VERRAAAGGRRPQLYRLTPRAGVAVGVEIGRRHIQVVVADGGHRRLVPVSADEPAEQLAADAAAEPQAVLAQAADLIRRAHEQAGAQLPLLGVGLGLPVPITNEGRIATRTLLPAWAEVDVAAELARRFPQVPIRIANDATLGAFGEHTFGAARGVNELFYVKLGWGIGAGIVTGGRSYHGVAGTAGEFGHMAIRAEGLPCPCGSTGCLELYAGGKALLRQATQAGVTVNVVADLVRQALDGNPVCQRIIEEAATTIGHALGAVVNLISPAMILLGGSLSAARDMLLGPLRLGLKHAGLQSAVAATSIEFAQLGPLASAWGGVALVTSDRTRPFAP
jgi:predicted NBD/HSP70 family sugar kinase